MGKKGDVRACSYPKKGMPQAQEETSTTVDRRSFVFLVLCASRGFFYDPLRFDTCQRQKNEPIFLRNKSPMHGFMADHFTSLTSGALSTRIDRKSHSSASCGRACSCPAPTLLGTPIPITGKGRSPFIESGRGPGEGTSPGKSFSGKQEQPVGATYNRHE